MKTRIAPSPTGIFHLGTLRTALLNYCMARANSGSFLLRIDDTDQVRASDNRQEYIDFIYSELNRFGLDYDFSFQQSSRLKRYAVIADLLVSAGLAKLNEDLSYSIDMIDNQNKSYVMTIIRSDGYPTYNFASVVDDFDYDITHIVRGVDHILNADKQKHIWSLINKVLDDNKSFPELIHAGLLFDGVTGKKLSKRSGNGLTTDYADFSSSSILNWLFMHGWSHPASNFDKLYPILSLKDMIAVFNEGKINSSNTKLRKEKLIWLNKKHAK